MAQATTQEFTLHLPLDVAEMLLRAASERKESPDEIVAELLRFSSSVIRQEAFARLKSGIRKQQHKPKPEIKKSLSVTLASSEQHRLTELLELNRTVELNLQEREEMQRLFDRIEEVATEKASAIWLLSGNPGDPDKTER